MPIPVGVEAGPELLEMADTVSAVDISNTDSSAVYQQSARRELVVVDTSVENYEVLVQNLLDGGDSNRQIDVITIDGTSGLEELSEILEQQSNLDALHLVTHGSESTLQIGGEVVDFSSPGANACLLYTSPSPRDATLSRMPSSA